jgi:hypothetical protein
MRTSFNDGWTVQPWTSFFAGLGGSPPDPTPVTLPHDSVLRLDRTDAAAPEQAYFPSGAFDYTKHLDVPERLAPSARLCSSTLRDEAGTLVTCADRTVRVEVEAAAVFQGLGIARPVNDESFLSDEHRTSEGRAVAAVRPTGPGPISVTVSSPYEVVVRRMVAVTSSPPTST